MTQFDEREKAFEKRFELDEAFSFKVAVKTAKLFGRWAASQLSLSGSEVESYAGVIADLAVSHPGQEPILIKVEDDLRGRGLAHSRHRLEKEIGDCERMARTDAMKA